MQVLLSEFATYYEAYAADRAAALPPLGFQFADFAAWQRGALGLMPRSNGTQASGNGGSPDSSAGA